MADRRSSRLPKALSFLTNAGTKRRRAEEVLRESEARYRSFIESSHEVIFSKDREGRYRNLNLNAAVGLGGSCIEDVEGKTDYELLSVEQADSVREADERVRSSRKALEVYEVVKNAKGEDRIYLSQKWPSFNESGEVDFVNCFALDITERMRAEETLRRQREEQQIILDSVPALIFYKDRENRFLRVNRALVEASGIPREVWEGGSAFDLFPNQAEDYWRDDKAVMESGQARRNIIEPMETATGTRWVRTDKIPYRDADGQIIGIIGFSADITEQKRLEEQLQNAREELEGRVERQMLRRNPYGLTFRESTVLHLVSVGRSDKEIATELVISPQTVHKHVANILAKMDAASRTEAATRALREGLLE